MPSSIITMVETAVELIIVLFHNNVNKEGENIKGLLGNSSRIELDSWIGQPIWVGPISTQNPPNPNLGAEKTSLWIIFFL